VNTGPSNASPPAIRDNKPTRSAPWQDDDHRERSQVGNDDRAAFLAIPRNPPTCPPPKPLACDREFAPAFWANRPGQPTNRVGAFRTNGPPTRHQHAKSLGPPVKRLTATANLQSRVMAPHSLSLSASLPKHLLHSRLRSLTASAKTASINLVNPVLPHSPRPTLVFASRAFRESPLTFFLWRYADGTAARVPKPRSGRRTRQDGVEVRSRRAE
jgi:hypothetical protein